MTVRRHYGFTLAEILISIALLAIALLGVMGSVAYGTRHARSGEELAEAANIARSLLAYMQETTQLDLNADAPNWPGPNSGINDEAGSFRPLTEAPFGELGPISGDPSHVPVFTESQIGRYSRNITVERLSNDRFNHRFRLARAVVQIRWDGKYGPRTVELTGLLSHDLP